MRHTPRDLAVVCFPFLEAISDFLIGRDHATFSKVLKLTFKVLQVLIDSQSARVAEPVDEQNAVQMIRFVLHDTGGQTTQVGLDFLTTQCIRV